MKEFKLKRLCIPDEEKARRIIWVEYPVCDLWDPWWRYFPDRYVEHWEPDGIAEIQIRYGVESWN